MDKESNSENQSKPASNASEKNSFKLGPFNIVTPTTSSTPTNPTLRRGSSFSCADPQTFATYLEADLSNCAKNASDDIIVVNNLLGCRELSQFGLSHAESDIDANEKLVKDRRDSATAYCEMSHPAPSFTGASVQATTSPPAQENLYSPIYHHWFYGKMMDAEKNWFQKEGEMNCVWKPFSTADSMALESAYSMPALNSDTIVATDGNRYDVHVMNRERRAVYWEEPPSVVRRCSWFSRGPNDHGFVPYEENIAATLEEVYKQAMTTGIWGRKVKLTNEVVIINNGSIISQSTQSFLDISSDTVSSQLKPRLVKRGGYDEFEISDGEPETCDHLLFLIHGIGQFCDLKFRSIIEVVDESRSIMLKLTQKHFQDSCETGEVNRIEILPVSWHKALHNEDTGIDQRLKNITLPSIPRFRDFSNDTILDVLFYTSPVFCQVIVNAVSSEMNRIYALFRQRNPSFRGGVSVGGHSLGSLILFDLLSNQSQASSPTDSIEEEDEDLDTDKYLMSKVVSDKTRRISVVTIGKAGTGHPYVKYPRLTFNPDNFFAFGSPIACFVATRSSEILGEEFSFPTCQGFFNIFHPYDPIAYRLEPLIIPSLSTVKPVQIPHHKGRKRMHLELKETVTHVGQRLIDSVKSTWNMFYHLTASRSVESAESVLQQEVSRVLESEAISSRFSKMPLNPNLMPTEPTAESTDLKIGCLNQGRRVDYVLQEAPVEYFNEYLFALASHLCYWTSRDSLLLVLREIYRKIGVTGD